MALKKSGQHYAKTESRQSIIRAHESP